MSNGDESFSIEQFLATSTPAKVVGKEQLKDKPYMYKFLTNLLGISMSNKVLADILIYDDPDYNTITIVGRPQVLGSSTKQMRHVIPYAFINQAIEEKVKEIDYSKRYQITDFARDILYTLLPLSQGVCLNEEQYEELKNNLNIESECFDIKITTKNKEEKENVYYLISDSNALKECESLELDITKARNNYNKKFHKYIMYGLDYLEKIIEAGEDEDIYESKNTLTLAYQGIVQLILTIFNQKPGICFAEEGNSLQGEFRLYKDSTQAQNAAMQKLSAQQYEVKSYKGITDVILARGGDFGKNKQAIIRRVVNEGPVVKHAIEALHLINKLVELKLAGKHNNDKFNQFCEKYNEKYNGKLKIDILQEQSNPYNEKITLDNLSHHIAKHLHSVFDFKPLESKVLVPKVRGDIMVYPSAEDIKEAKYSIKDGNEYRESQYNKRKGYNKHALFRYKMEKDETNKVKELLAQAIIMHISISLVPFSTRAIQGLDEKVFYDFKELVCTDYNSVYQATYLDDAWKSSLDEKFKDALSKINESINRSRDPSSFIEGVQFPTQHASTTQLSLT